MWIVTVKLPRNPLHNPHNKRTSVCPLDINERNVACSDALGQHHSFIVEAAGGVEGVRQWLTDNAPHLQVTRIEQARVFRVTQ